MKSTAFLTALTACIASAVAFITPPHACALSTRPRLAVAAADASICTRARQGVSGIEMKRKGKPNVNISQRGSFNQMQQRDAQYQEQQKQLNTGMPAFQIFARSNLANMWYPCGMLKGDDKAKATVDAMMGGFLSGVSKYSLEKGVASSVLQNKKSLIQQVGQAYPQLKGKDITFGYKIIYKDFEEKMGKQAVTEIKSDMTMGPLDAIKKKIGF